MSSLPRQMRVPRKVRATNGTAEGWYYINPRTISVLAEVRDEKSGTRWVTTIQMTRRQLKQALAVMDRV